VALLSVIVTCFREGAFLEAALRNVRSQLAATHELILVNDASTDAETNRACAQAAAEGVRLLRREQNGGLSATRNAGVSQTRGDVLVFLDGDDLLPAGALAAIESSFNDQPNYDFLCGNYRKIDASSVPLEEIDTAAVAPTGEVSASLLMRTWSLLGTSPVKRSLWRSIGGYDESPWLTNSVQDIDFFQRALATGARGRHLPRVVYDWRIHNANMHITQPQVAHSLLALKNRKIRARFLRVPEAAIVNGALHSVYAHGDTMTFRQLFGRFKAFADWKNIMRYYSTYFGVTIGKSQSPSRVRLSATELDHIVSGTTPSPAGACL
jgi:glycosyltransferase involved in cell wall biosynthesis